MAIVYKTDLPTDKILCAYNNNVIRFKSDSTETPISATITFNGVTVTLYPNPNNGSFNIQFNSNSGNEISVEVHDMRGRSIYNKSYTNNGLFNESLQLNNAQAGVYLVTVQDGSKKEVKKIVVQ